MGSLDGFLEIGRFVRHVGSRRFALAPEVEDFVDVGRCPDFRQDKSGKHQVFAAAFEAGIEPDVTDAFKGKQRAPYFDSKHVGMRPAVFVEEPVFDVFLRVGIVCFGERHVRFDVSRFCEALVTTKGEVGVIFIDDPDEFFQIVCHDDIVVVDETDVIETGRFPDLVKCGVTCKADATVFLVCHSETAVTCGIFIKDRSGFISGTVVDGKYSEMFVGLGDDCVQTFAQVGYSIVDGKNDGDVRTGALRD